MSLKSFLAFLINLVGFLSFIGQFRMPSPFQAPIITFKPE